MQALVTCVDTKKTHVNNYGTEVHLVVNLIAIVAFFVSKYSLVVTCGQILRYHLFSYFTIAL